MENVISDMEKSIKSIFECFNSSYLTSIVETVSNALSWYANNAEAIALDISTALESLGKIRQSIISNIYDVIDNIEILEVSDSEKKELKKNINNGESMDGQFFLLRRSIVLTYIQILRRKRTKLH